MKNVILLLLALSFSFCSTGNTLKRKKPVKEKDTVFVHVQDTIKVEDHGKIDSLEKELKIYQDSLVFYRDTVLYENYINARRIEKIKYYISITERKPSNQKFFYGWIRRTMSEN